MPTVTDVEARLRAAFPTLTRVVNGAPEILPPAKYDERILQMAALIQREEAARTPPPPVTVSEPPAPEGFRLPWRRGG